MFQFLRYRQTSFDRHVQVFIEASQMLSIMFFSVKFAHIICKRKKQELNIKFRFRLRYIKQTFSAEKHSCRITAGFIAVLENSHEDAGNDLRCMNIIYDLTQCKYYTEFLMLRRIGKGFVGEEYGDQPSHEYIAE